MDGEALTRCQQLKEDPLEQEEEDNSELPTIEPLKEEVLDPSYPDRKVLVGSLLPEDKVEQLMKLLRENKDVFAWSHIGMPRMDPEIACHRLNVDPNHPLYQQKQRRFVPQRNQIISDEVDRLLEAGFIQEVW
ncbi:unnamed protein product, partial [Prunus brigantina]